MVRLFNQAVLSHSLVCIKNHLFIIGVEPILNKELDLIFFDLIAMIVRAFIVRYQYYTINYIYINVTKIEFFYILKCNAYCMVDIGSSL